MIKIFFAYSRLLAHRGTPSTFSLHTSTTPSKLFLAIVTLYINAEIGIGTIHYLQLFRQLYNHPVSQEISQCVLSHFFLTQKISQEVCQCVSHTFFYCAQDLLCSYFVNPVYRCPCFSLQPHTNHPPPHTHTQMSAHQNLQKQKSCLFIMMKYSRKQGGLRYSVSDTMTVSTGWVGLKHVQKTVSTLAEKQLVPIIFLLLFIIGCAAKEFLHKSQ